MVKSAELNIGWVAERGPGAGAWPFWLATGMLICCLATIYRWFKRTTPESRSMEAFISPSALTMVVLTVAALAILLLLTQWIGIYFALMLFLDLLHQVHGRPWLGADHSPHHRHADLHFLPVSNGL